MRTLLSGRTQLSSGVLRQAGGGGGVSGADRPSQRRHPGGLFDQCLGDQAFGVGGSFDARQRLQRWLQVRGETQQRVGRRKG